MGEPGPGAATWDAIVDELRQEIEHHDPNGASAVSAAGPVRAVTQATLALMSDAGGQALSAGALREAAAEATATEVDVGLLVGAATSTARTAWERLVAANPTEPELAESGRRVLLALHVLGTGLVDAYAAADFELSTAIAEAHRGFLDELLSMPPRDRTEALRRRRRAERYGLDPETSFRVTLASPGQRSTDAELDAMVQAVKRVTGGTSRPRLSTLRFPDISELRGRLVVLDIASPERITSLRAAFESSLGKFPRWVAIAGPEVAHLDGLAPSMERLREAIRTAELVGRTGWVPSTNELDLETLLSLDDHLRRLAIDAELGPLIRDTRLGPELIATLETYFATGQNAREAARRLRVAPRTVTYRLQRVRELRSRPADPDSMLRLAVAVFAYGLDRHHRADRQRMRAGRVS